MENSQTLILLKNLPNYFKVKLGNIHDKCAQSHILLTTCHFLPD